MFSVISVNLELIASSVSLWLPIRRMNFRIIASAMVVGQ
jgi:hypothetical protein